MPVVNDPTTPTVNVSVPVPTPVATQPRRQPAAAPAPPPQPVPQGGVPPALPPVPAGFGQVGPNESMMMPQPEPSAFILPFSPEPRQRAAVGVVRRGRALPKLKLKSAAGERTSGLQKFAKQYNIPGAKGTTGGRKMNGVLRYMGADSATVDAMLAALNHHDLIHTENADRNRRMAAADALRDAGREEEADLLAGENVVRVRGGRVLPGQQIAIVTRPRGAWRWQNAYGISKYVPTRTARGDWVWRAVTSTGKYSEPQLRGMGHGGTRRGSLHSVPLTETERAEYRIPETERGPRTAREGGEVRIGPVTLGPLA